MKFAKSSAFTLIELVVSIGVLMIMSTTGIVGYGKIMNVKAQVNTKTRLQDARDAYLDYYAEHGVVPTSLADFAAYASAPGDFRDGWNRHLHLFSNIDVVTDGTSIHYDAAIVSTGLEDTLSTTLNSTTHLLTLSDRDITIFVSADSLRLEKMQQVALELSALHAATLQYYSQHAGVFPSSISQIAILAGLTRQDGSTYVDPWQKAYRLTSGSTALGGYFELTSAGPSQSFTDTSDNVSEIITLTQISETAFERTTLALARANAALQTYKNAGTNPSHLLPAECTDASSTCAAFLCSDFLDGTDALDFWGTPLYFKLSTETFYSAGEDLDETTTSDNIAL